MNELRQKVRRIKLELNLSDRELSKRLGKSQSYLSKIFEVGISTARQKALSDELDKVAKGELFISKEEYIKILLRDAEYNRNCMKQCMNKVNDLRKELNEAKSKYQTLNSQAIGDMLDRNSEIEEHQATITHLTAQLNQSRETMSKQSALNESLNNECQYLTEQAQIIAHNSESLCRTIKKLRKSQKIHRLLSLVCLATIILLIVTQWGV